jgi:hypothetical protein
MNTHKIYTLSNPLTNEIFYIGCTKLELKDRLSAHYRRVTAANKGSVNWNKRLSYLHNLLPTKAIITEIDCCSEIISNLLEKHYIKIYSQKHSLTNQTIGGKGGDTYSMLTEESKKITSHLISKKIKGVAKPTGFSENLSKQRKGYGNPQAGKTKHPPIILENENQILIFKNALEANLFFNNRHTWSTLTTTAKHNTLHDVKWKFSKTYSVSFIAYCNANVKDIVQSFMETEGNCYVFDKHTQKITIK